MASGAIIIIICVLYRLNYGFDKAFVRPANLEVYRVNSRCILT